MRALAATGWMTLALMRRAIREGIVLRSFVVPGAIAVLGLLVTMIATVALSPASRVGIPQDAPEGMEALFEAEDIEVVRFADPEAAVENRLVDVAVLPGRLVLDTRSAQPLVAERAARTALGGHWRPAFSLAERKERIPPPQPAQVIVRMLAGLFCLYGVVFGAGGIARDRSEGLLDVELAVGVPHTLVAVARWTSSVLVILLPLLATIAAVDAVLWVEGAFALALHAMAGVGAAVAIGIIAVGQADLDRGFSGPLATGLGSLIAFMAAGTLPVLGTFVPIGSIVTASPDSPSLPALLGAGVLAVASWWSFSHRTAVA